MSIEHNIKQAAQALSREKANVVLYSTTIFDEPVQSETIAEDGRIIGLRRGIMPVNIDAEIVHALYEQNAHSELLLPLRANDAADLESTLHAVINGTDTVSAFRQNGIGATRDFNRFVFIPPIAAYGKTLKVLLPHQGIENISWFLLRNTENTDSLVYNPNLTGFEEFEKFVSATKIDVFGFSPLVFDGDFKLIGRLSQLAPESLKIMGGPAVRHVPPDLLFEALYVDVICYGRGEETSAQISKRLRSGYSVRDLVTIPNIAINIDGKAFKTGTKRIETCSDNRYIDDIPIEEDDVVHRTHYIARRMGSNMTKSHLIDHVGEKRLVVEYSDYCKARCVFCNVPRNTKRKSLEELYQEISIQLSTGKYDSVHFIDNTFSTYPDAVGQIASWFVEQDLVSVPKACKLRIAETTHEMLAGLAQAGFTRIFYGIESFDDNVLARLKKGTTSWQNEDAIEETLRLGMIPGLNIILPTPYDTPATITRTIERALYYTEQGATLNIVPHLFVDHNTPLFYDEPSNVVYKEIFFEGMKSPYMMPVEARFPQEIEEVVRKVNPLVEQRLDQYENDKHETVSIHCYSLMHLSALSNQLGLLGYRDRLERLIERQ
jgi:radical SAM superfamily enzyme YgiQ (UPF0313 family)